MISPATDAQSRLAVGWRMWVASGVIMLCSWLSYVDRQVLAVLSPMILRDTRLSVEAYAEACLLYTSPSPRD